MGIASMLKIVLSSTRFWQSLRFLSCWLHLLLITSLYSIFLICLYVVSCDHMKELLFVRVKTLICRLVMMVVSVSFVLEALIDSPTALKSTPFSLLSFPIPPLPSFLSLSSCFTLTHLTGDSAFINPSFSPHFFLVFRDEMKETHVNHQHPGIFVTNAISTASTQPLLPSPHQHWNNSSVIQSVAVLTLTPMDFFSIEIILLNATTAVASVS